MKFPVDAKQGIVKHTSENRERILRAKANNSKNKGQAYRKAITAWHSTLRTTVFDIQNKDSKNK